MVNPQITTNFPLPQLIYSINPNVNIYHTKFIFIKNHAISVKELFTFDTFDERGLTMFLDQQIPNIPWRQLTTPYW